MKHDDWFTHGSDLAKPIVQAMLREGGERNVLVQKYATPAIMAMTRDDLEALAIYGLYTVATDFRKFVESITTTEEETNE